MAQGFRMEIDITDGGLGAALTKAVDFGQNLTPLLDESADILLASTDRRFEYGAGPGGIPWPVSGRAAEQGGKTLVDRGSLRRSMAHEIEGNVLEYGVDGQDVSAKYAATHQYGATIRPKTAERLVFTGADGGLVFADEVTIPARPFIGIDEQDSSDLEDHWTERTRGIFDES